MYPRIQANHKFNFKLFHEMHVSVMHRPSTFFTGLFQVMEPSISPIKLVQMYY